MDVRARVGTLGVPVLTGAHPVFGDPTAGDTQLFGVIDDARIFSARPSDDDILNRAMTELDGSEAGLVMYIKFSEGTGATAYDSVGTYNGTLGGTAQWVGFEGGAELTGQRKPKVWGIRRQRKGFLVDQQRLVWQVNNGQTQSIVPKENGWATLASDGDFACIYDATPAAGHYATQLSKGLIRFGVMPTGTLSFDVQGDVDPEFGYTEFSAEIMRNIARRQGGLDILTQIDTGAVAEVATSRPDSVGHAADDGSPVRCSDLLSDLAGGIDGWWTFTRDGLWTLGVRAEPGIPEIALTENDIVVNALERSSALPPVKQWTLSYRQYQVTVDFANVNPSVPADQKADFGKSERFMPSAYLTEVADRHKDARFASGVTLYDQPAAVRREVARRLAIDRYKREIYKAPLLSGLFQYRIGQSVSIRYSDGTMLMNPARSFVVGGFEEDTQSENVSISVWGKSYVPV